MKAELFLKTRGAKIDPTKAEEWIKNYFQNCVDEGEDPTDILKSLTIEKDAIMSIFSNPDAVKLRMYIGKVNQGHPISADHTLILVGVGQNNENILGGGEVWDNCTPCPSDCPSKDFI